MSKSPAQSRNRVPCRRAEYHDEYTRRCLDKCGENMELLCSIYEYCDAIDNKCRNKCSDLCAPPEWYCDHVSHYCGSCYDVCAPWRIHEYNDCRIHCPDVYGMLKNTTLVASEMHTTVPATTAVQPTTSNTNMQTTLAVGIALPITCIVTVGIVIGLICWKKHHKKTRSPVQDGDHPNEVDDTTRLNLLPSDTVTHTSEQTSEERKTLVSQKQSPVLGANASVRQPISVPNSQTGHHATNKQLPASIQKQPTPTSGPHTKLDLPKPLSDVRADNSNSQSLNEAGSSRQKSIPVNSEPQLSKKHATDERDTLKEEPLSNGKSSASDGQAERNGQHTLLKEQKYDSFDTGGYNSLAFDSGSSYGINLTGIPDNLEYREGSPISPAMAAAAAAAQLNQHPRIDYEEQIRKIKAMNWGSMSDLDLREDAALAAPGDLFRDPLFDPPPAELKLSTPTPSMQARIDERVRIIEILDKLDYVVYHMFSRDNVTVVIRPSDITLGEARRQLIELGIPEEDFTLDYFRYDSTESSDSYPSPNLRSITVQPPAYGHESLPPENGPIPADSGLDLYPATGTD